MTKKFLYKEDYGEEGGISMHHSVYANAQNKACQIHSYIEWGDYIFFEYRQNGYYPVLYNKKTGDTLHYETHIINDLLVTRQDIIAITTEFLYTNSKAAYDYIEPSKYVWYQDPKIEFVSSLDKREELIKLLSDTEEHCVILEYEFK
jgi:hypothetical protein